MTSKATHALEVIAKRYGLKPNPLAHRIINELVNAGIIEDTEDNYGYKVGEVPNDGITAIEFCKSVRNAFGIDNMYGDEYLAALELVILGDYDCPYCGSEMDVIDQETRVTYGDGYESEYEYEVTHEVKRCPHCGAITSY